MKKLVCAFMIAAAAAVGTTTLVPDHTRAANPAAQTQQIDFSQRLRDRLAAITINAADISKDYAAREDLKVPGQYDLGALLAPLARFETGQNSQQVRGEDLFALFKAGDKQVFLATFDTVNNVQGSYERQELEKSDACLDTVYDENGNEHYVIVLNANSTPREQQAAVWHFLNEIAKASNNYYYYVYPYFDVSESEAAVFPGVPDKNADTAKDPSAQQQAAVDQGSDPAPAPAP